MLYDGRNDGMAIVLLLMIQAVIWFSIGFGVKAFFS